MCVFFHNADGMSQVFDRQELTDIAELVKDNKNLAKFTFDQDRDN